MSAVKSRHKFRFGVVSLAIIQAFFLSGCSEILQSIDYPWSSIDSRKSESLLVNSNLTKFETVTDKSGTYTRTYVDITGIKDSNGFELTGELLSCGQAATTFTTLEGLDSIVLDNESRWDEWKTTVAPRFISSSKMDKIFALYPATATDSTFSLILSDLNNAVPTLLRDGGVRVADKRIASIQASLDQRNINNCYASLSGTAVIYANDVDAASWLKSDVLSRAVYNSDGTLMSESQRAEALQRPSHQQGPWNGPTFTDGKHNATVVRYSGSYVLSNEGGRWMITEANNTFEVNQALIEKNAGSQLDYRSKIN